MRVARRLTTSLVAAAAVLALAGCDPAEGSGDPSSSPGTSGTPTSTAPTGTAPTNAGPTAQGGAGLQVLEAGGGLRVTAQGLPAGELVEVLPCSAGLVRAGGSDADAMCSFNSDAGVAVRTSADGTLDTTVDPEPYLKINGHEVLCDTGCVLGVVTGGRTVRAVAPYELPDGVVLPDAPRLAIESWTYDVAGNTGSAVVRGSGFEPGADVDLSQCPAAADGSGVDGADCLYEYGTAAVAGDDGTFRVDVAAYPLFQRSDGERADEYVDCVQQPADCAIGAPWVVGERIAAVTFDTAP
ncbi:hypothetical protein [Myceligenerans indicum]|uniref:Neocarzinostatin family protein n=1 Tax=Myceligenerans indicum TaxID=2593663 RepID=A0ABS1LR72_9MICO|nr:hypothetical protein [Myceligenerans indicum]MBL0888017.1 hypothetical protein [Myceligenerans indicum]